MTPKNPVGVVIPTPVVTNLFTSCRYPRRGEVVVFAGNRQIFNGKWQHDFHTRLTQYAYRTGESITVKRARDYALLFSLKPCSFDDGEETESC